MLTTLGFSFLYYKLPKNNYIMHITHPFKCGKRLFKKINFEKYFDFFKN
jgi:hypothetical protein